MRTFACVPLFFIAVCLQSCATFQPQGLSLAHDVNVPKEFRAGNFSKEHPGYSEGNSTVERYVSAYERGWWVGVDRYASDIDLEDPSTLPGNGWIEEAAGFSAGYADARDRIQLLIHAFGKQKVSAYLQKFKTVSPEENSFSRGERLPP